MTTKEKYRKRLYHYFQRMDMMERALSRLDMSSVPLQKRIVRTDCMDVNYRVIDKEKYYRGGVFRHFTKLDGITNGLLVEQTDKAKQSALAMLRQVQIH